jgi:di/tricarboxylate transporter
MEAPLPAEFHIIAVFAVIAVTIVAYASERFSIEAVSLGALVALLLLFTLFPLQDGLGGIVTPTILLDGFSNPALITVIALLVIGQALYQTDALEPISRMFGALSKYSAELSLGTLVIVSGIISAFMNNTPVVIMVLPIAIALAAKSNMPASKVLMSLSFVSILGGMTTLIGSSTNLLVAETSQRVGGVRIDFFDVTVPGMVLAGVGALYAMFVMPKLLTSRTTMVDEVTASGKQFIAHIDLDESNPLIGSTAEAGLFIGLKDMTVRLVQRGERYILPPFNNISLQRGDRLIVSASREALTASLTKNHGRQNQNLEGDSTAAPKGALTLVEVVIAPASRLAGRTLSESYIFEEASCVVLGIERRSRMPRGQLDKIRLEPGDVLLIGGTRDSIKTLRTSRDVLLMEWSAAEIPHRQKGPLARIIFAAVVVASATGLVPIVVAAITGALAMIAGECIKMRQAARAIDRRIIFLIAAAIALAIALEQTGGANLIATSLAIGMHGSPPWLVLSVLFLVVAILTNILSNNATAVLFTPIALGLAYQLELDPVPFIIAVILAANCCFATPIGYQTNLLVMGPGHYKFKDFLRAGTPLVILCWITFTLFAPWYYGLWNGTGRDEASTRRPPVLFNGTNNLPLFTGSQGTQNIYPSGGQTGAPSE